MKKNCIFLLLDSVTFDSINSKKTSSILFPNLHYLATKFNFKKCVSNSNCTQFVLPSLFSMSMPLDEGGYDYGIKYRKKALMEILQNEGYTTAIFSNCNQMGADNGYDRGANENINSFDYRLIIEQKINRVILSKFNKDVDKPNRDEELVSEYKNLIFEIKNRIKEADTLIWSKKLKKINLSIVDKIDDELKLIEKDPEVVKKKLITINPASIWRFLGEGNLKSLRFYISRILGSIIWRLKFFITKSKLPITILGHITINIIDSFDIFKKKVKELKKPYFIYHHIMDLHDCENLNSFSYFFKKLMNYPKWIKNTRNLRRKRKFLYDSTLMLVDNYIGKILQILDSNTLLFITSDHGHRKSLKKQISRSYITDDYFNEMHGEDIEVPLISNINLVNENKREDYLFDSILVSKKIISELDIDVYKYLEVKDDSKEYIISEHAGRGNFNLYKDLYFTISSSKFRMIAAFIGSELFIKFYNLDQDIDEMNDVSKDKNYAEIMNKMFNYLKTSRREIVLKKLNMLNKVNNQFIQI